MCVMLLLNIAYIRVFYYNVGQGVQFGAVDKFECSDTAQTLFRHCSDRGVLSLIPTCDTSIFFCQLLSTMLCMCSRHAPYPLNAITV